MIIENINKMIILSSQKQSMLEEILDISRQQSRLIKDEDFDKMGKLLQNKQDIMHKVDLLDINFLELYNQVKEKEEIETISHIDPNKYSNLKDLKNTIKTINAILDDIASIDKENTDRMQENLKTIRQDIKSVKDGKKAYKGYSNEYDGSMLIDEKK